MPIRIDHWPAHLNRNVSSSFTLGSLNGAVQPVFQAAPRVFADPFEQRWFCTMQSPTLGEKEVTLNGKLQPSYFEVEGRIARLKGMGGYLRLYDTKCKRPQFDLYVAPTGVDWSDDTTLSDGRQWVSGYLPAFVTVDEVAHVGAESIVVRGLPVSTARVFRIGDRCEARPNGIPTPYGNYYMATEDARSNASGKVRLYILPGLRIGLNIGDMIALRYPTSVFSLVDDKQGVVNRREPGLGEFGFSLIETLPSDA